jgi:hypothetical protein
MRIAPLLLVALLAGSALAATTADACGPLLSQLPTGPALVRWTWGSPAAPVSNQDFAGPGIYTQTISATGLSGTYSQFEATATLPAWNIPAAWSMLYMEPYADCQGHPSVTVVPVVAGTEAIPGATASFLSSMPVCWPPVIVIDVMVTFAAPVTFDPAMRYGIATLSFDLSASVTGPGDATHCGGAEAGVCFTGLGSTAGMVEWPALTWQGSDACIKATPARATAWGALKQIYR